MMGGKMRRDALKSPTTDLTAKIGGMSNDGFTAKGEPRRSNLPVTYV